jgi:hypothetical protein
MRNEVDVDDELLMLMTTGRGLNSIHAGVFSLCLGCFLVLGYSEGMYRLLASYQHLLQIT